MQRTYEVMFIVRPDLTDEDQDKLISTLETQIGNAGGTIKSVDKMGKRRLAYVVRKFMDGFYILMTVEGTGEMVHELERRLRARASDSETTIQRRLADARQDLQHAAEFDYIIVNDNFDVALGELCEIVKGRREGCAIARGRPTALLDDLLRT